MRDLPSSLLSDGRFIFALDHHLMKVPGIFTLLAIDPTEAIWTPRSLVIRIEFGIRDYVFLDFLVTSAL